MKIGICCGIDRMAQAEQCGFDYIEPPLSVLAECSDEEFGRLAGTAEKSLIRCEAFNLMFPGNIRLTGSRPTPPDALDAYLDRAFSRCRMLGGEIAVFGSGAQRSYDKLRSREQAWNQLLGAARLINAQAEKHGVTVALEPLNREETNIVNTVEEGVRFVREAGLSRFRLLADFYHIRREDEPVDTAAQCGGELVHVHIANSDGRTVPRMPNEDRYKPFFEALRNAGYNGRISIEAAVTDMALESPRAIKLLRSLL